MGNCKVVAKINRRPLLELVSAEGMIDSVVSVADVTTELILQYIRAMQNASASQVKTLHRIADNRVEALEFSVTEDFPGIGGEDALHHHDDVIVVTTDTRLQDLRDILQ